MRVYITQWSAIVDSSLFLDPTHATTSAHDQFTVWVTGFILLATLVSVSNLLFCSEKRYTTRNKAEERCTHVLGHALWTTFICYAPLKMHSVNLINIIYKMSRGLASSSTSNYILLYLSLALSQLTDASGALYLVPIVKKHISASNTFSSRTTDATAS